MNANIMRTMKKLLKERVDENDILKAQVNDLQKKLAAMRELEKENRRLQLELAVARTNFNWNGPKTDEVREIPMLDGSTWRFRRTFASEHNALLSMGEMRAEDMGYPATPFMEYGYCKSPERERADRWAVDDNGRIWIADWEDEGTNGVLSSPCLTACEMFLAKKTIVKDVVVPKATERMRHTWAAIYKVKHSKD